MPFPIQEEKPLNFSCFSYCVGNSVAQIDKKHGHFLKLQNGTVSARKKISL